MESDNDAQLEPPTHNAELTSHFIMAPQLGVHADTKNDTLESDSNSSGSEDGDSSSNEDSSDSDMDGNEDPFVIPSTTAVDQIRNQSSVVSTANMPVEVTAAANNATSSVVVTAPTVVNRPPTSMKRLRNMFAAVKQPETAATSVSVTVNATAVPPLYAEAITPVTPVSTMITTSDANTIGSMHASLQQPQGTVTATTVTSEIKDAQLPRKSNTKRMTTSFSNNNKTSVLSEESSSDSEGEESGEVTNSDSEDDDATPKPPKQPKWDKTSTVVTPEATNLQLICSIPRVYVRTIHTPVSTPKSPPVSKMAYIAIATVFLVLSSEYQTHQE